MKDAIGRQFYFFFPSLDSFIYFSNLTAVARTSKTTLNKSGRSCLFPDLRGNALSFSPLRMTFAEGLWNLVFIMLIWGFTGGSEGKGSACNAGDLGSIPGSGRSVEKEMATHSSILVWKISWIEEPGGLQSMGSQRVRHNWVTNTYVDIGSLYAHFLKSFYH